LALWFAVIPALLAALVVRFFVPPAVVGTNELVKDAFHFFREHSLALGIGLFLAFAAVARYWRLYLPGGRYLSAPTLSAATPAPAHRHVRDLVWLAGGMALAAAAVFAVRRWVVESYSVLSGSMLPTLQPEDRVAGNRLAYRSGTGASGAATPRRGDIIVFRSAEIDDGSLSDAPEYLVKRVIGLPGDRISMRNGIPVINGFTAPVCDVGEYLYLIHGGENGLHGRLLLEFLDDRIYMTVHAVGSASFDGTYEVQPGELFVLGDNRNNSSDSRAWNNHRGGGVPLEAIEARVAWFVAGRRADLSWDFGRLFRRIEALATEPHLDGVNLGAIREGVARCLEKRPENTSPPPPGGSTSAALPGGTPGP